MATPQLKSNAVMERIKSVPADAGPGDFLVKSIRGDIAKIRKLDAAVSYMLEGMLCTALRDKDAAISAHENSMLLAPARDDILWNYYASLGMLACYRDARMIARKLISAGHISDKHIEALLWSSLLSLDIDLFNCYQQEYGRLVQNEQYRRGVQQMIQSAQSIQRARDSNPALAADMDRIYLHIESTLFEHRETAVDFTARENTFYGQHVLHLDYPVETSLDNLFALNDALLEKISRDEQIQHWDAVIATFVHAEAEEQE